MNIRTFFVVFVALWVIPTQAAVTLPDRAPARVLGGLRIAMEEASPATPLDVIVTFNRPLEQVDSALLPWQCDAGCLRRLLPSARAAACSLRRAQIEALSRSGVVAQLEEDEIVHTWREASSLAFGATYAREDFEVTGDGDGAPDQFSPADHTIAIIDTGIDTRHVDFSGGKVIEWRDYVNHRATPYDDHGHGTHVASIAAGRRPGGGPAGVAPGAALVGLKVLGRSGSGRTSDIAAAIQFCIDERQRLGIRVINLSLGTGRPSDGTDLSSRMVESAVEAGMVVVVAAGNSGSAQRTTGSPAAAEAALTVGSMADPAKGGFALSPFSSRGPTADGRVKPDLCAPGESVLAARSNTLDGERVFSGTSMAAPFVAGVVSLMCAANPALTPTEIKEILLRTAIDFGAPGKDIDYGAGRMDAYDALREARGGTSLHEPATPRLPAPVHWTALESLPDLAIWERPVLVTGTAHPLTATLIIHDWARTQGPDFELRLLDASGRKLVESATDRRQERLRIVPTQPGLYIIQIVSYAGSGGFSLDVSGGEAAPRQPRDTEGEGRESR